MNQSLDIVILGLSITSSWGNGHASTYRALVKGLAANGHNILFLERDAPWYAENRDNTNPVGCQTVVYSSFEELVEKFESKVRDADLVILGSYVPEGIRIGRWLVNMAKGHTAFYDIDTPITLELLQQKTASYIDADLVRKFQLYLSFTGGPILKKIEKQYGSPMARALYCAVDTELYQPKSLSAKWSLGYLGTYSEDRQHALEQFLLNPARDSSGIRFAVAGPQYPPSISWPDNVDRMLHLAPPEHPAFYGAQSFTLNITRFAMKQAGYSPSVRLFEAGACATPVISDWWNGLDTIFAVGTEILVAEDGDDILRFLRETSIDTRLAMGRRLRARVLQEHSPRARARQIERYLEELSDYVSSDSARGHRRARKGVSRITARLGAERLGKATSASAQLKTFEVEA